MGALAGVPFAPKDLFDTAGLRTTYGSAIFRDHVPTRTASAVQRIVDAGAVIVGKANLHEFAWGVTSKNPFYGTVGNPRRPGHVAGGSSGGSAAALSAGPRRAQHRHRHGRLDPHPVVRLRHRRASSRATGSCRSTAATRSCPASTTPGRWRGRWRSARSRSRCSPTCRAPSRASPACASACSAPIADIGTARGLGRPLRGGGAAALGARAADLRGRVRVHPPRALSRRGATSTRPTCSARWRPASSCTAVDYRALWDEVEAWRAALRAASCPTTSSSRPTLPCELPLVEEEETPEYRARVTAHGAAVQLARLALGDDARRRDVLGPERRDRARGRARLGGTTCRPRPTA